MNCAGEIHGLTGQRRERILRRRPQWNGSSEEIPTKPRYVDVNVARPMADVRELLRGQAPKSRSEVSSDHGVGDAETITSGWMSIQTEW